MNFKNKKQNKGITLFEVIIAIGIITIIFTFGTKLFVEVKNERVLDNSVGRVISLLQEARSMSVSSVGASRYGVHFEETKTVLFKGNVYSSLDPDNKNVSLNSLVSISEINLAGEGSDVVFNRLDGETDNSGTIKFILVSNPAIFKVIEVSL